MVLGITPNTKFVYSLKYRIDILICRMNAWSKTIKQTADCQNVIKTIE